MVWLITWLVTWLISHDSVVVLDHTNWTFRRISVIILELIVKMCIAILFPRVCGYISVVRVFWGNICRHGKKNFWQLTCIPWCNVNKVKAKHLTQGPLKETSWVWLWPFIGLITWIIWTDRNDVISHTHAHANHTHKLYTQKKKEKENEQKWQRKKLCHQQHLELPSPESRLWIASLESTITRPFASTDLVV